MTDLAFLEGVSGAMPPPPISSSRLPAAIGPLASTSSRCARSEAGPKRSNCPGTRAAKGVLDIRGSIVQVYDLGVLIGGQGIARGSNGGQVVLVVSIRDHDVGVLVDSVSGIIFADSEDLRPAPASNAEGGPDVVSELAKIENRLIAILDLCALFPPALS